MSFLPAEPSHDTTNLFVPNSFLIFRLVFFALLSNLALLQVIFASWNINAGLSMTHSAPSISIFVISQSCMLFFSLAFALADFVWSRGRNSRILLECSWVGAMSLFQIGTAIGITITGPGTACNTLLEWNFCASSSLLIPSTWLSSMLFLAYFLTLFMFTMAHKDLYSDIWRRSVYEIVWFGRPQDTFSKDNVTGRLSEDIENSSAQKQHSDPISISVVQITSVEDIDLENSLAQKRLSDATSNSVVETSSVAPKSTNSVRRGIDAPFSRQCSHRSSPTISSVTLPSCLKKRANSDDGSRFIETFRESRMLARPQSSEHVVANHQNHKGPFPPTVMNVDVPIPLPCLSEWVRADALKGISVHTNPHTSVEIHNDQTKNTT